MWCCFSWSSMFTDSVVNDVNEQHSQDDVTDDSCRLHIIPLTRDTDGLCTTACDSGDWSAEFIQEVEPDVKLEPEVVYSIVCYIIICIRALLLLLLDTFKTRLKSTRRRIAGTACVCS